jgi:NADH-quinone oxidoreductase subunit L
LLAALSIGLSWFLYASGKDRVSSITNSMGALYKVIKNKFYFDEIYLFITHNIIFRLIAFPIAWFDRYVVDGGVNLSAWGTRLLGGNLNRLQSGQVQAYGAWFVTGVIAVLLILWAVRI